ncbi:hypothetical protein [Sedimentitalea arenosa]|jgi:hypothetical protein|uniref:Uncharacterized protein n=1 Tax=Sedimentitalea arenosa TaxID=2798803 RepID=A0A8J7LS07_9RHOB|nr:hypothetical protein [Arenibacterium arenosum]MBJ6371439.1 hypothetical protein [Arenibacterium arenosum]
MNISIALPVMAPQPTGHPASLPPDPAVQKSDSKVMPAGAGAASDESRARDFASRQDRQTAPPTAIQRKIMEILEQQALEMAEREDGAAE